MEVNSTHFYLCLLLLLLSSIHSFVESFNEELTAQDIKRSEFPHGFFFGTATSSYQIEGAFFEDGKSLSNWDNFTHIQDGQRNGANGDIANDHYRRYLEDIEITHSLGVNAYRFSISWARVLPRGRFGEVNPTGVMFYNKIIDYLLFKGIEPFVTINHNDFPQELEDRYGSWLSPLMQEDFVHFAETCFKNFGDRVKYWITINEPNLFAELAYIEGIFPPSHCSEPYGNCSVSNSNMEQLIAMHNMLLSHAKATTLYRECFQPKQGGFIGIVACAFMYEPMTDDELDREAASRALAFDLAWVFDPLVYGDYPPEMRHYHGNKLPTFSPEEVNYIKGSIDFIGINHYSTYYAKDCIHSSCTLVVGDGEIIGFSYITGERNGVLIGEQTGMVGMYVVPRGMEEIIDYVKERYQNKPIFVLENGYAQQQEGIPVKDLLHDVKRIEFHKAYLASLATAIRNGADVRGYFIWTLMDDFEWLDGYNVGFGLYYVHRPTLKRMPKLSAKWFRNFLTNTTSTSPTSLQDKVVMSRTSSFRKKNVIISGLKADQALM
ncbi:Beta-glucosidase 18 [Camellia lanceoleosa]|uniref:Beta-glucosidase 18 n=1 Tax=Camellia lanceoleosa TaxID=1840588 RepID=A0ACC0GZQ1_9ERIC|nr:Beta-glucosidase 18 [Camellia lanceoleosa]